MKNISVATEQLEANIMSVINDWYSGKERENAIRAVDLLLQAIAVERMSGSAYATKYYRKYNRYCDRTDFGSAERIIAMAER